MSIDSQGKHLKTEESEQLCRASVSGIKDISAVEGVSPLADDHGRLWVRPISVIPPAFDLFKHQKSSPPGGVLVQSDNVTSFGLPAQIINISGYNANPSNLFVQIFDSLFVNPGDTPVITIPVPGNFSSFSYGAPFVCLNGISIAISLTSLTYTVVVTPSLSYVAVFYQPV